MLWNEEKYYGRGVMPSGAEQRRRTNVDSRTEKSIADKEDDDFLKGFNEAQNAEKAKKERQRELFGNFRAEIKPPSISDIMKTLDQTFPFVIKPDSTHQTKTQTEKPASMPVGGDIQTNDEMELFLSGMRENDPVSAQSREKQKTSIVTNPQERSRLVDSYQKELDEKAPWAVHERAYKTAVENGAEKPWLEAIIVADRDKNAREEQRRLEKEIKNVSFAKDIEKEGRIRAQEAFDKEFGLAKARGDMNPALVAIKKGEEVLAKYEKLASDARNGLYYHNLDNEIAGYEKIREDENFRAKAHQGNATMPYPHLFTENAAGKKIVNFINNDAASVIDLATDKAHDAERLWALTEDEKNVMRAYAADEDFDSVEKYYDLLERRLNERVQNKKNEETRQNSYEYPILNSMGNVASSFSTPLAYFSNAGQAIKNGVTGKFEPTDINSPAFRATHYGEHSEDGIVNRVYDEVGGDKLGEFAASATRSGLSLGREIVKERLGKWSMPFEAFGAAGQNAYESLKMGKDSGETLVSSSAKGAIAGIMEKLKQ